MPRRRPASSTTHLTKPGRSGFSTGATCRTKSFRLWHAGRSCCKYSTMACPTKRGIGRTSTWRGLPPHKRTVPADQSRSSSSSVTTSAERRPSLATQCATAHPRRHEGYEASNELSTRSTSSLVSVWGRPAKRETAGEASTGRTPPPQALVYRRKRVAFCHAGCPFF